MQETACHEQITAHGTSLEGKAQTKKRSRQIGTPRDRCNRQNGGG